MRSGLASKFRLGVASFVAACGVGGCQSGGARPAGGSPSARAVPSSPRVSVASVDAGTAPLPEPDAASAISQSDVIGWVSRGTADDVILDRIRHAPNAVRVTAADELRLRDAGATDEVIRALEATGWN